MDYASESRLCAFYRLAIKKGLITEEEVKAEFLLMRKEQADHEARSFEAMMAGLGVKPLYEFTIGD